MITGRAIERLARWAVAGVWPVFLARWARLFERMARWAVNGWPFGPKRIEHGPTGLDSDLNTSHAALEQRLQGMAVTTLSLDVTHCGLVQ